MYVLTLLTPAHARSVTVNELTEQALTAAAQTLDITIDAADTARRLAATYLDSRRVEGRTMVPKGILIVRAVDDSTAEFFRRRVPAGWLGLVLELDAALRAVDPDTTYTDVKPKWGELRVYLSTDNERALGLAREATRRSRTICEVCGAAGTLHKSPWGWHRTLCPKCAAWMGHTAVNDEG
ncbi:MAG: hypothetical protein KDB26_12390 [Microthrixaceae bacterium]|nr:hypothetical protein [Microthrixaceae bacterium]